MPASRTSAIIPLATHGFLIQAQSLGPGSKQIYQKHTTLTRRHLPIRPWASSLELPGPYLHPASSDCPVAMSEQGSCPPSTRL